MYKLFEQTELPFTGLVKKGRTCYGCGWFQSENDPSVIITENKDIVCQMIYPEDTPSEMEKLRTKKIVSVPDMFSLLENIVNNDITFYDIIVKSTNIVKAINGE